MNTIDIMRKFVEPCSVAIIGATRKTGEFSMNIMEHLLSYGFQGKLYPVNPHAAEILGIKAFARLEDIGQPIDLAIVVTNRETVPAMLKSCSDAGIPCASVVAQGFGDALDHEGRELDRQMQEIIRATGIRVLGPNTFGTANAFINFSSSFARIRLDRNPVGIVCQSGLFFHGQPEFRLTGKCIDLGNGCDIGFDESIEYFEHDPQVRVIGLHIEGVKDTARFLSATRRAAAKKPVIILKTGRSSQSAKAMESHTGSLAGNSAIWDAALKNTGAIRVNDYEEFFDIVRLFSMAPQMKNNNLAIATFSGAAGILAMDALRDSKLKICSLSEKTVSALTSMAPAWLNVTNPVDYWPIMMGHPDQGRAMADVMDILLSDDDLGGVLFLQVAFTEKFSEAMRMFLNYLSEKHPQKPFVSALPGTHNSQCIAALQADGRHLAFHTPERAARAFSRLWEYSGLRSSL